MLRLERRSFFGKSTFLIKIEVQDAIRTELGAIRAAKRHQKGGQKRPKRRQKRDQNNIEILIDFWTDCKSSELVFVERLGPKFN